MNRKRGWNLAGFVLVVASLLRLLIQSQRPSAREIGEKLRATTLPRLWLEKMPCGQAVDLVVEQARREHLELRRVPVIYRVEPGT